MTSSIHYKNTQAIIRSKNQCKYDAEVDAAYASSKSDIKRKFLEDKKINHFDTLMQKFKANNIQFTLNQTDDGAVVRVPFRDSHGSIMVGFDEKQTVSDVTFQPNFFPFAHIEKGYNPTILMGLIEAFISGSYELKTGTNLPFIPTVKVSIKVDLGSSGTLSSSARVKKDLVPLFLSRKLF